MAGDSVGFSGNGVAFCFAACFDSHD